MSSGDDVVTSHEHTSTSVTSRGCTVRSLQHNNIINFNLSIRVDLAIPQEGKVMKQTTCKYIPHKHLLQFAVRTHLPWEVGDVDVGAVDDPSLWVDRGGIGQRQHGEQQQGEHGGE
jgi:hypothetical protein